MTLDLTPRQHSFAAYAAFGFVVLSGAWLGIGPGLSARISFAHAYATLQGQYAQFTQAVRRGEAAQAAMGAEDASDAPGTEFFHADTAALAAADLQHLLKDTIEGERGTIVTMAVKRMAETTPFAPVAVMVHMQCSVETLTHVLYRLEAVQPTVFIDNLSVQSQHQEGRQLPTTAIELEVRFDAMGYLYQAPAAP